ncbi:MAG TPA: VWA domain-containing protein [Planctomycetota bacterium]|nr:VWA domain-containing protein [Planctomycetota bacterium]
MIRTLPTLALASLLAAQGPAPTTVSSPAPQRPIDLAICLDISGSMDGLLNAARQNLWAVVNELATLKPVPTLRVALLTYGCSAYDAETGWVRVDTGFTSDLDTVSQKLFELTTNGGDEYVARVVHAAVEQLDWSKDPKALKLLFVAGNEAATQDPKLDTASQSKAAIEKGIVVNAIYCGSPTHADAPGWREVAKLADGTFATIEQDNGVVIATPFDGQLTELSAALNTTYVPYGKEAGVWAQNQERQDSNAARLNSVAAAQRCQTKASSLYSNAGWDLVDACSDPKFKLEDVKKEDLPENLRAMSLDQLREHVTAQQKKRAELKAKVEELGKQRDAHVQAEMKKLGDAGARLFEHAVLESVRQQAEAKGFQRQVEPAPAPEAPAAKDVDSPFVPVVKEAVRGYAQFVRVTGSARVAPTLCRAPTSPPPLARLSKAGKHGGKVYLLYARFADGLEYVKPGEPAKVGQTLVKEAWERVDGPAADATEASQRYGAALEVEENGAKSHAGDAAGLFVMHKLAAGTPDTDGGWIYATIDRTGVVTGAGRMASCIRCHESATEDRQFGLR